MSSSPATFSDPVHQLRYRIADLLADIETENEGLDGSQKMSKSLDNHVGVREAPGEQWKKLMRLPNQQLPQYFTLLTDVGAEAARALLQNPLEAKFALGRAIVTGYHGAAAAAAARAEYDRVHQQGGLPDVVPEVRIDAAALREGRLWLPAGLAMAGLCSSNSEGRRLVQGGGVRVDGAVVKDPDATLGPGQHLLQVGKQKAARVVVP